MAKKVLLVESSTESVSTINHMLQRTGLTLCVANDGVYGIIVPAQPSGTRMRFYIEAISDDGYGTRTYFPARKKGPSFCHGMYPFVVENTG